MTNQTVASPSNDGDGTQSRWPGRSDEDRYDMVIERSDVPDRGGSHRRRAERLPFLSGRLLAGASMGAALLLLAACGSSSNTATATTTTPGTSSSGGVPTNVKSYIAKYETPLGVPALPGPSLDPAKVAALRGKTVLFVPATLEGTAFLSGQAALKQAFGSLGMKLTTCDANDSPTAAAACLTGAKATGASAIVTALIPYAEAESAYDTVAAEHIPVLLANADPGSPANSADLAFQTDSQEIGPLADLEAATVIEQSGGHANVLVIEITDSAALQDQSAAINSYFKANCPGCHVVQDPFSVTELPQLGSNVSSEIIDHPSTNYILSESDEFIPVIAQALATSAGGAHIAYVGEGGTLAELQSMAKGGPPAADIGADDHYAGLIEADGVLRMLTGDAVPRNPLEPLRVFDSSNVKGLSLTASSDIDNWYGASGALAKFTQLWTGK